jgi:hypothetical protein
LNFICVITYILPFRSGITTDRVGFGPYAAALWSKGSHFEPVVGKFRCFSSLRPIIMHFIILPS